MLNLRYFFVVIVVFFALLVSENDADSGADAQLTTIITVEEYEGLKGLKAELEKIKLKNEITDCYTLYRNGFHIFDKKYCLSKLKQNFQKLNLIADNITILAYYSELKHPGPRKQWMLSSDTFEYIENWSDDESAKDLVNELPLTVLEILQYSDYKEKYTTLPQELRITAVILWLIKTDEWRDDPKAKVLNGRLEYLAGALRKLHIDKKYTIIEIARGIIVAWHGACNLAKGLGPNMTNDFELVKQEFIRWYSTDSEKASHCAKMIVDAMKKYPPVIEEHNEYLP